MGVKVLLVGLDGATFSVLDRLVADGVMPFLGRFMAEGARAHLRTIVPPLTPPAWTSLSTGRSPGHHGVFDFFRMDPGSRHIRFSTSEDVAVPTIWDAAAAAGLRVTALNFPLMFPPPRIPGHVVPGWVPWRQLRLACHPPGLFDRLKARPGFEPRELAIDIKLEERATEGCANAEDYAPWIELHTRREAHWFEVFRYLHESEPSELTAVLFDGMDKLQHLCWRFIDCESETAWDSEWERQAHELCQAYYRRLDGVLERMCGMVGPDTLVVIASDHGFGPTRRVFHVNAWLERQGLLAWSSTRPGNGEDGGALLGVGQVARHTFQMDWERTRAFATTPTSNGIYIQRATNGGPGVPEADYVTFRERLVHQLLAERDPETDAPLVSRVDTREEAFAGPYMERAPDLTLSLVDGGLVSILPSEQVVSSRPTVAGSHRPLGVFLARGGRARRGVDLGELSILDVAPTVLYGLGLRLSEDLEGRMPEEMFDPGALKDSPVEVGRAPMPTVPREPPSAPHPAFGQEEEAVMMKRLRELGYIE